MRHCRIRKLILGLKPLFSDHLTDGIVNSLHRVTVSIGHLLETSVAVLVGVLNESFALTLDADGFKVVELIVSKSILHAVTANDLGHIIEGVVSVGDMRKLGAICLLAGDLSGSVGVIILICSLVTKFVGYFLVTRCVAVNRVCGLVTASVGL